MLDLYRKTKENNPEARLLILLKASIGTITLIAAVPLLLVFSHTYFQSVAAHLAGTSSRTPVTLGPTSTPTAGGGRRLASPLCSLRRPQSLGATAASTAASLCQPDRYRSLPPC
ncbi:hypothetical protein EYF80_059592 [Liparis tanakae]|uniref:Uncharacterized protein n=1 Tax=Liparis tanakae TaxID=230148 RepID=A0A4Z2EMY9_9TELE|nr:hypothetical protein EYF80_059592 [Liparis tanakae]